MRKVVLVIMLMVASYYCFAYELTDRMNGTKTTVSTGRASRNEIEQSAEVAAREYCQYICELLLSDMKTSNKMDTDKEYHARIMDMWSFAFSLKISKSPIHNSAEYRYLRNNYEKVLSYYDELVEKDAYSRRVAKEREELIGKYR